jgi:hypothetical protein
MTAQATARRAMLVATVLLVTTRAAIAGDRQIRPFVGATFGAGTSFFKPDDSIGKNLVIGASAVFIGEIFGVEADVADVGGFFESDESALVIGSRVTTVTGNLVIAAPHKMTEYGLRPYVVAGGGLMRIKTTSSLNIFDVSSFLPSFDLGAGVVGFITKRVGVSWELRRFQNIGGRSNTGGLTFGPEDLSFWRGTMSVAFRY